MRNSNKQSKSGNPPKRQEAYRAARAAAVAIVAPGAEPMLRDHELASIKRGTLTLKQIRRDRTSPSPVIPFVRIGSRYLYIASVVDEALRSMALASITPRGRRAA